MATSTRNIFYARMEKSILKWTVDYFKKVHENILIQNFMVKTLSCFHFSIEDLDEYVNIVMEG